LQAKGFESAKPIIEALKSKGVSSMGAAGFCWGCEWLPLNWFSLSALFWYKLRM